MKVERRRNVISTYDGDTLTGTIVGQRQDDGSFYVSHLWASRPGVLGRLLRDFRRAHPGERIAFECSPGNHPMQKMLLALHIQPNAAGLYQFVMSPTGRGNFHQSRKENDYAS